MTRLKVFGVSLDWMTLDIFPLMKISKFKYEVTFHAMKFGEYLTNPGLYFTQLHP